MRRTGTGLLEVRNFLRVKLDDLWLPVQKSSTSVRQRSGRCWHPTRAATGCEQNGGNLNQLCNPLQAMVVRHSILDSVNSMTVMAAFRFGIRTQLRLNYDFPIHLTEERILKCVFLSFGRPLGIPLAYQLFTAGTQSADRNLKYVRSIPPSSIHAEYIPWIWKQSCSRPRWKVINCEVALPCGIFLSIWLNTRVCGLCIPPLYLGCPMPTARGPPRGPLGT